MSLSLATRFMAKVTPEPNTGCWLWTGAADEVGYGFVRLDHKTRRAHRVAWELFRGPILGGLHVLHRCDNPPCVNPPHLFLGTNADNIADRDRKGRTSRGRGHAMANVERRARGEMVGSAKLTEADVLAIRSRAATESKAALGREFGLSPTSIGLIVSRKNWNHVP